MTRPDDPDAADGTNGASATTAVDGADGADGAGDADGLDAALAPFAGYVADDAPPLVAELADACVRFVERALTVRLDFTSDTLSVLDHYVAETRKELADKPEALGLVARAVGAYFGEVVRRRVPSFWHLPSEDPAGWELQLEPVFLAVQPVAVAYDAIALGDEDGPTAAFELEDEDRGAVEARLGELPQVGDEEFYSLATRLEVLDIVVDAVKARMMSGGLGDVSFGPSDYED